MIAIVMHYQGPFLTLKKNILALLDDGLDASLDTLTTLSVLCPLGIFYKRTLNIFLP